MEPRLSSGADGFSDMSIDNIISFLDRDDITCDLEVSGPTPLLPTGPPPTKEPAPPPSSRAPVSMPPTPYPTLYPSALPSHSPLASPPAPPLDECFKASIEEIPSCIVEGKKDRFVCFDLFSLIPPYCPFKKLSLILETCDGLEVRSDRRRIMTDSSSRSRSSKGAPENGASGKGKASADPANEAAKEKKDDEFEADDCTPSCIFSFNRVCLNAKKQTVHELLFVVLDEDGRPTGSTVTKTVTVEKDDSDGCVEADLKCKD